MNHNETPTPKSEELETDSEPRASSKWSILEKMADKYDAGERGRIDQMKDNLSQDQFGESSRYRYEQIDIPPSTLRKIGRLALDRLGIHFARSETRRRREAMAVAVQEYDAEQEEAQRRLEEQIEYQRREMEREAARKKASFEKEKASFEKDFVDEMELYRKQKQKRFQIQRIQEIIEQDLNQRLLTVSSLENEVLAGNPEVDKAILSYAGTEVQVYTLRGIPFSMISHDVEYRKVGSKDPNHIGVQTSKRLVEDPGIWAQSESEAMQDDGFGAKGGNARGNVISTSYINSESNLDGRVSNTSGHADLCYGFSHINGGELLFTSQTDGGTSNIISKDTESLLDETDLQTIDSLEGASDRGPYNEFLIRRYSETGEARRPDYVITENGEITDDMLRHATFFRIPIVNIDRAAYEEKMEHRAANALNSVNGDSTYEEISAAIDKIKTTSKYSKKMKVETRVGDGREKLVFELRYHDHDKLFQGDEINKKIIDLGKLEIEKRIDFIASELQKATEACHQATREGQIYYFSSDSIEEIIQCDVLDYQNGKHYTEIGEEPWRGFAPGNPNTIKFAFRMKDSTRYVCTEIVDGERRTANESNKKDVENSDSSYYDKIYPLIMAYMNATRENRKKCLLDKKLTNQTLYSKI